MLKERTNHSAHRHSHAASHATLPTATEGRTHNRAGGSLQISIGHHDHKILGSPCRLHSFSLGSSSLVVIFGYRSRPDKADVSHLRMTQHRFHRFFAAMDAIYDAARK